MSGAGLSGRVGIVGANGFIGRHLCSALNDRNWSYVALVRSRALVAQPAPFFPVDYLNHDELVRALDGCAAVIHVAGAAHIRDSHSQTATDRLVAGNEQLSASVARACRVVGVARLINLSSAGVLGQTSGRSAFDEFSPPQPYDSYTRSKLAAEHAIEKALSGSGVQHISVRPPMVYGPDAPGNFSRVVGWIRRGLPLPLGSCAYKRSMISVRNLCDALCQLTQAQEIPSGALLVCDEQTLSIGDFARGVARRLGRESLVWNVPPALVGFGLAACGKREDWRRLSAPFEIKTSASPAGFGWRAPFAVDDELDWSLIS